MTGSAGAVPSVDSATSEPVDLTSSTPHTLAQAVHARQSEYVRPHRIRIKIGSWNVAGCPGTDKDLGSWFVDGRGVDKSVGALHKFHNAAIETAQIGGASEDGVRLVGGDKIGLYVLGLQETIDLNVAKDYVNRMNSDPGPTQKWKQAIEDALPDGYELIMSEQMSGLLLLIYAAPDVAQSISNVSTVSVGTGLFGYFGNKGAVTTRILLGETTRLVFVNCHLASGSEGANLERRLWDIYQITSRTQFSPVVHAGVSEEDPEKIGDEDFAFWFGDLNFRLESLPGEDIRRLLQLHVQGEYDVDGKSATSVDDETVLISSASDSGDDDASTIASTNPSTIQSPAVSFADTSSDLPDPNEFLPDPHDDPASVQATLDSLLPHDQLQRMIKEKKAFHDGWREGPITFLPTYKYDVGTVALFDTSEKKRAPSWCDRILYRTRTDREQHAKRVAEEEEARKKDEEMKAQGMEHATDDDEVLFSYDPENDADDAQKGTAGLDYDEYDEGDDEEPEEVVTKEGFTDHIQLDIYTSHQRIMSSDHKPIISVFSLDYDAVVPELKAHVHAEVARELDRAENEGRPFVTIVLDTQDSPGSKTHAPAIAEGEAVDFGEVGYMSKKAASLTIANTGRVPAKFSFVEKPTTDDVDTSDPPRWLSTFFVRPDPSEEKGELVDVGAEVTLDPGETVSAVLGVMIRDIAHVRALNDGRATLDDILVLRVEDGRDHFIPVRGTWLPTCFGRSIEELIRVPDGGIRAFAKSRASESKGSIPYDLDVRCAAPKELFKLTEAVEILISRVLADENMLEGHQVPEDKPGWPFDKASWQFTDKLARQSHILKLIDALDTDEPLVRALPADSPALHHVEVVSEVLVLFLEGLTDGIITAPLWAKIDQTMPSIGSNMPRTTLETEDDKTAILDILTAAPHHNIAFVFLTTMLSKVVADLSPISKSDIEALKSMRRAGTLGRRSLSFRRRLSAIAPAEASVARRRAREGKVAELFAKAVCRVSLPAREKERKAVEDRIRGVLEMFLRKPVEDGYR